MPRATKTPTDQINAIRIQINALHRAGKVVPCTLFDSQVEHQARLIQILTSTHGAIDTSPTGSGKTVITCKIALDWNYPVVIVIGPPTLRSKWEETGLKYGVVIYYVSYHSVSGKNSPLLTKNGDSFTVKTEFLQLAQQGILLVSDETSFIKNADTARTRAFHTLARTIAMIQSPSRILLLSASPVDKDRQAESLCKSLALITCDKLYEYEADTKTYTLLGLQQLINIASMVDSQLTNEILCEDIDRKSAHRICKDLYVKIIKGCVSSSAPARTPMSIAHNGYFRMPDKDQLRLIEGVEMLKSAVRYRDGDANLGSDKQTWGQLSTAMQRIERSKRDTLIRLARESLEADPMCKVIVCMEYKKNIARIAQELRQYNPLVLDGDAKQEHRGPMIAKFRQPNERHRLFIMNTSVGCVGIDLDDMYGTHPRKIFIVPTYKFQDIYQAAGRVDRAETKSIASIKLVYGQIGDSDDASYRLLEQKIFDALHRKSEVAREMLADGKGVIFPGDYPVYIEPQ